MRKTLLFLLVCTLGLLSCQKEMSGTEETSTTTDSLLGNWNIEMVSVVKYTAATPSIDTLTEIRDNTAFCDFKADSSFLIYEGSGYAFSGSFYVDASRELKMQIEKETFDNFGTATNIFSPPVPLTMSIQTLTANRAILTYRMAQSNQTATVLFHYFLKK
jgi:hypothetical protein